MCVHLPVSWVSFLVFSNSCIYNLYIKGKSSDPSIIVNNCVFSNYRKCRSRALWDCTVLCVKRSYFLWFMVISEKSLFSFSLCTTSQTTSQTECVSFWHLLNFFSGALRHVACGFERLALLRKDRFSPAATACRCQCGPRQPSISDRPDSLLVVRSLASLKALRTALQPYCDNSLTGGLTAGFI